MNILNDVQDQQGLLKVAMSRPINPDFSPVRRVSRAVLGLPTAERHMTTSHSGVDLTHLERLPPKHGVAAVAAHEEVVRVLDAIAPDCPPRTTPEEVDLVISGGGLRGYYLPGALHVLTQCKELKIRRIAGASAGSWCAAFYFSGLTVSEWVDTYRETQEHISRGCSLLGAYDRMRDCMPEDAHIRCSGKVFVSITVVDPKKGPGALTNLIVSEFTSRDDLMDACMASSCIPYISDDGLGRKFRGQYVVDGGVINNVPHFHDHKRRQIVFRLSQVNYPMFASYTPVDPCAEALVIRGALEARRFLSGLDGATSIEWVAREKVYPDPNALEHRINTLIKFGIMLLAAMPVLLLFLVLKKCSSSFNGFLKRGMGVTGSYPVSSQVLFGLGMVAVWMMVGWQARVLILCGTATILLSRLHNSKD